MLPIAMMVLFIAAGELPAHRQKDIIALGLILFLGRLTVQTWGWHERGSKLAQTLQALQHVPQGARIAVLATDDLCGAWPLNGFQHAASLAIVRNAAFVNTEWDFPGQSLMTPTYNSDVDYNIPASGALTSAENPCKGRTMATILADLPRQRFDYIWVFAPPAEDSHTFWLQLLHTGPDARLYRILKP